MIFITILLFFLSRNFSTFGQTYNIGLQTEYFTNQNVPASTPIIQYTAPNINNFTGLREATANPLNLRFLIHQYSVPLIQLTNILKIPYLIIPETGNNITLPNNVFYMSSIQQQSLECTQALLAQLNVSIVVFIDYKPDPQLRSLVGFLNIPQTLFMVNDSNDISNIFVGQSKFNSANIYVCTIPLSQNNLITNLLTEAMIKGQLNPGKVWIFSNVVFQDSSTVFLPFQNVGATIYTFNLIRPPLTANTFLNSVVTDYINFIVKAVASVRDASPDFIILLNNTFLLPGSLAEYANFDPVTHKYNGTIIDVMKANTASPQKIYTFNNILIPVQINPSTNRLNDPSKEVKIGVLVSKGYSMLNPSGQLYGYSMAILNKLLNLTTFKYRLFNYTNENQTASQKLNSVLEGNEVDLILTPMVDTLVSTQADKTDVVLKMTINMLTRGPDLVISSVALAPFTYNVWFAILLIIILMTLGFWAVSALNGPLDKNSENTKKTSYSFGYILLAIYSSFTMAKLKVQLLEPSSQLFAFILWFATLTMIIAYASNMLPYLMKTNPIYPFNNASYFVNTSDDNSLFFVRDSDDIGLIQNDSVLSVLYNKSLGKSINMFVNDLTSESILLNSSTILIQNSLKNNYIYNTLNCSSNVFTGTNKEYSMVFAMRRNWELKDQMNDLIKTLINTGATNLVETIYFNNGPCARSFVSLQPTPAPLSLNKLFLLFLFPLCGCVGGISFAVLYILCGKLCRCIKNSKREKFIVGQTYDAKVSSLENSGVWAFINQRDRPYFVHSSSLHPDLRKQYSPKELEIKSGDILHLKYFGKDPINKYKRFCKDFTDA